MKHYTCVAATDAGMWALWRPTRFAQVEDYDSWEAMLLEDEDIGRHITEGALVPISIGCDGSFGFEIRIGDAGEPGLTPREQAYLVVSSSAYLLVSEGEICFSGIEHIGMPIAANVTRVSLPAGRYRVTVHLIEWNAEPGAKGDDGAPTDSALPDFLILIGPENARVDSYRTQVRTFDRPEPE
jgi:hypothetical protein